MSKTEMRHEPVEPLKTSLQTELTTHNGLRSYEELVSNLHLSPWEVEKFLQAKESTVVDLEGDE